MNEDNPFYKMIQNLFLTQEVVLYGRLDDVSDSQRMEVVALLESYYDGEAADYPVPTPSFSKEAASWSAMILFCAAQLIMHREQSEDSLSDLFPKFDQPKSPSAIITSDLCLRFLPSLLKYLDQIDVEDELIPILKRILEEWHYSGLLCDNPCDSIDFKVVLSDSCLRKLYVDRVIEQKKISVARNEAILPFVLSAIGNHEKEFWRDLNDIK